MSHFNISPWSSDEEEEYCMCNRSDCHCQTMIIKKTRPVLQSISKIKYTSTNTFMMKPPPTLSTVSFTSTTKGWASVASTKKSFEKIIEEETFRRKLTGLMHQTNELVGGTSRYLMCNHIIKGLKCTLNNCSFAHTYDSLIPVACKKDCIDINCPYIHSFETHPQFYQRLKIIHKKKREHFQTHRPYMMCKRKLTYGKCTDMSKCNYAHSIEELAPKICKYKHNCNRRETCPFLHHEETKEELVKRLKLKPKTKTYSKMCHSYLKRKKKSDCKKGSKCTFAHGFEHLVPNKCTTSNCSNKKCLYIHTNETREQFRTRLNY